MITCGDRRLSPLTEEVTAIRLASLVSHVELSAVAASAALPPLSGHRGGAGRPGAEGVALYPTARRGKNNKGVVEDVLRDRSPGSSIRGRDTVGALPGPSHPQSRSKNVDHLRGRSATLPTHLTRRHGDDHARHHHFEDESLIPRQRRTKSGGEAADDRMDIDVARTSRESPRTSASRRPVEISRSLPSKVMTTSGGDKAVDVDTLVSFVFEVLCPVYFRALLALCGSICTCFILPVYACSFMCIL